jgi:uncharacterized membrane protein YgcG
MARQLFYGYLSDTQFEESGSNVFIRFSGDFTLGSNTITNVDTVSGYFSWDTVRVGQTIVANPPLAGGSTISSFDEAAQTITIAGNATATSTSTIRISPASGQYYVSSSLYDPQSLIRPNNITGSEDLNYISSEPKYSILGLSKVPGGAVIPGRFHKYEVTEVLSRDQSNNQLSVYLEWGEKGTEADSGDVLSTTDGVKVAISALTDLQSLSTMFSRDVGLMGQVSPGSDFAGYQIEVQDFLDDLTVSDIFYTGSLTLANTSNLNFSGSGVEVTTSGSDGVLINISGGGGGGGGTSGTSGSSGSSGTSGSSGSSGTSGTADILNDGLNRVVVATGTSGVVLAKSNHIFTTDAYTLNGDITRQGTNISVIDGASGDLLVISGTDYMGAVVEYSFESTVGSQRFGTIRINFDSASAVMDETSTPDLNGSTEDVVFSVSVSAGDMTLLVTNNIGNTIELVAVANLIFRN